MTRTPFIVIWLSGRMLKPDLFPKIKTLNLIFPKKKAASGKLVLLDNDISIIDSNVFKKGQRISFLCGWRHELKPVGPYIIKSVVPTFPESGEISLSIEFQDKSHKANKKQKQKKWLGFPHKIVKEIAKTHNLGYDIESIQNVEFTESNPLIQSNQTDAALLQRLAYRYGYTWGVNGNNLIFRRSADMAELGIQSSNEIPVLTYRGADKSIKSFSPKIKYSKGGKRKNTNKKTGNIDFLSTDQLEAFANKINTMDIESIASSVAESVGNFTSEMTTTGESNVLDYGENSGSSSILDSVSNVLSVDSSNKKGVVENLFGADPFAKDPAQKLDDEIEPDTGTDTQARLIFDSVKGTWSKILSNNDLETDDNNVESLPGDPSGKASPANKAEAEKRNAAALIRASETISGRLEPTIASMEYYPSMALIANGLGQRISGRFEVQTVEQSFSGSSESFTTTLDIMKRKYKLSDYDKHQANKSVERSILDVLTPGTADTSVRPPSKKTRKYNPITDEWVRLVDGIPES